MGLRTGMLSAMYTLNPVRIFVAKMDTAWLNYVIVYLILREMTVLFPVSTTTLFIMKSVFNKPYVLKDLL